MYVGFTNITMEGIFTEGIDPSIPVEVILSGLGSRSLGTTLTVFIQITNIDTGGKELVQYMNNANLPGGNNFSNCLYGMQIPLSK